MKILIVEDIIKKAKQIADYLNEKLIDSDIHIRNSYQSGLKEIMQGSYDIVLLDMQLPNFDIKSGEDGYKFRKLAGLDILNELKRKKKKCKIIIITQFETFGENETYIELSDLKKILETDFSDNYLETVYYNPGHTDWKNNLISLLLNLDK